MGRRDPNAPPLLDHAALVADLARARVDLIELDTARDLGEAVRAFFRRRIQRYGGRR